MLGPSGVPATFPLIRRARILRGGTRDFVRCATRISERPCSLSLCSTTVAALLSGEITAITGNRAHTGFFTGSYRDRPRFRTPHAPRTLRVVLEVTVDQQF